MPDPINPHGTPPPTTPENPDSNTTKIAVGVVAGIAALAIAIFLASNGASSDDSCTLSVAAVGAIAVAASHGESAQAVIESAAFAPVCSSLVKTVINEPQEVVEAEVEGPGGESVNFEGTGEEFISPAPPESAIPNLQRLLDCVRSYEPEFLFELCSEGAIEPTV
jgi:hypothetical protein